MICRLCLTDLDSESSVTLFDELGSNTEPEIVKCIAKHLHLDINWSDEISTSICHECYNHLNEFYKYCAYISDQQIMLSNKVPVVDGGKAARTSEPTNIRIKYETNEDFDVTDAYLKCEAEEVRTVIETRIDFEPDGSAYEQLESEPEEGTSTDMALTSSTVSNQSACSSSSEPSNSISSHQTYADILNPQPIENISRRSDYVSYSHVHFVPDANSIKLLQPIKRIYQSYLMRISIQNKDRIQIAKSVIEECLKDTPARKFVREEFIKLAENIKEVFPSETVSTYYVPQEKDKNPSGKLWNAYKIKKNKLISSGLINKQWSKIINPYLSKNVTPDFKTRDVCGNININVTPFNKKIPLTSAERSRRYRARKREFRTNRKLEEWN